MAHQTPNGTDEAATRVTTEAETAATRRGGHGGHETAPDGLADDDGLVPGDELVDVDEYLDAVITRSVSSHARTYERRRAQDLARSQARAAAAAAVGCAPCLHAAAHGWWGDIAPARSHCHDCHRSWRSLKEGHCARCHRQFHNQPAFDAHLTADDCRDPHGVHRQDGRPRFRAVETPFGEVWRLVNYRDLPDFSALGA